MVRITLLFGILLMILGGCLYFMSETRAPTALIPAGFGLFYVLAAFLTRMRRLRKTIARVAALVSIVGVIMPIIMVAVRWEESSALSKAGQFIMAGLCGVFLLIEFRAIQRIRRERRQQREEEQAAEAKAAQKRAAEKKAAESKPADTKPANPGTP